ncbi:MAG: hypothetical protein LPJ89_09070, partial [Hymenobacteraceae bacterium]|nr:hypothetical protein [Hymenobacteraceae bacterium]MDX5397823.1 hypothetical protein [Hymenobacteraceae bacterium]MDX5443915.1 hypothetical protein [Hymenobacteraceae bacterium]MDX5513902.1 hypothetical protein [Hymenobacteraceae bacterium]
DNLKYRLSKYIHIYTLEVVDLNFDSQFIQDAIPLIQEVFQFIFSSLYEDEVLVIQNIEFKKLSKDHELLLQSWKLSPKMSYEELVNQLKEIQ